MQLHSNIPEDYQYGVCYADSEMSTGPVRMTPETWPKVVEYSTAYRVAKTRPEIEPTALTATYKCAAQAARVVSTTAATRDAASTANNNEIPCPTVT